MSVAAARPAPWQKATAALPGPLAVVDLDAFEANARDLLARAQGTPIRVASKSLRVRSLIERALATPGFAGVMAYSVAEALWLVECGVEDVLLGYPSVDRAALGRLVSEPRARARITLMVDDVAQVALVERALMRAGSPAGPPVQVCLDIDAGLRVGPVHVGPRRSPVRDVTDAVELAWAVERTGRLRVRGVMFYEGQVAGVGEAGVRGPVVRAMKRASLAQLAERRPTIVAALQAELGRTLLVNGGGSGSLADTVADPTITEVTAGSGLYCPTLFDHYEAFTPRPAAYFGLDVVRRPTDRIATAFSGGYIASGPAGADRLPTPLDGGTYLSTEGAGEVQTPLRYRGVAPAVGDRVWFRHAKAGEMMERFDVLHLVRDGRIEDSVPTYRGESRTFG
ncbi:alanine racemase [Pseudactinotalea sp.]|uniref:alanine racemase n=1 Tax=Pseudactinotalea sp. TaxID=1926260 RepID=UPI003B3AF802